MCYIVIANLITYDIHSNKNMAGRGGAGQGPVRFGNAR